MPWPGDEGEKRWEQAWTAIKKVKTSSLLVKYIAGTRFDACFTKVYISCNKKFSFLVYMATVHGFYILNPININLKHFHEILLGVIFKFFFSLIFIISNTLFTNDLFQKSCYNSIFLNHLFSWIPSFFCFLLFFFLLNYIFIIITFQDVEILNMLHGMGEYPNF